MFTLNIIIYKGEYDMKQLLDSYEFVRYLPRCKETAIFKYRKNNVFEVWATNVNYTPSVPIRGYPLIYEFENKPWQFVRKYKENKLW